MKPSEIIKHLKIISFRYEDKVTSDKRKNFGVVAQQIAEYFDPKDFSITNTDIEGFYKVDYIQLIPLLIKYIQDLEKRVEVLEKDK